jgi:hypothetical protein
MPVIACEPCRSCSGTADRSRADPDLSCDERFELLDAYAGLELARGAADAEMPLMPAHLRGRSAGPATRACALLPQP